MRGRSPRTPRACAALALAAWAGCAADPVAPTGPPGSVDAESAALALISARLLDAPDVLRPRFSPDVAPEAFPLRMMVDDPADLAGARLDRVRMVDGRAVVEARVALEGRPLRFDFWLERADGVWRVAGYAPTPVVLPDLDAPVPVEAPDPPAALLGPVFRAAHPVLDLQMRVAGGPGADAPENAVRVDFKPPAVAGGCKAAEVIAAVEHTAADLTACYQTAVADAPPRLGRLTFRLQYAPTHEAPRVELIESTLLLDGLAECAERALAGARLADRTCQATVPAVFIPGRRGAAAKPLSAP